MMQRGNCTIREFLKQYFLIHYLHLFALLCPKISIGYNCPKRLLNVTLPSLGETYMRVNWVYKYYNPKFISSITLGFSIPIMTLYIFFCPLQYRFERNNKRVLPLSSVMIKPAYVLYMVP